MSTAYSYPQDKVLKDAPHDPPRDPHKLIYLSEITEEHHLNSIASDFMENYQSTYSFSKALSEELVNEASIVVPTLIVRPSIVMPILYEPIPGWVDNIKGVTGLILAAAAGVLRVISIDSDVVGNFVPVDLLANALCISTFNYVHLK